MSDRLRSQTPVTLPPNLSDAATPDAAGADRILSEAAAPALSVHPAQPWSFRLAAVRTPSPNRAFYAAATILLLISVIIHAGRLARLTFTNHDDITMDIIASEVRNEGVTKYWQHARTLAERQGRPYFYFSTALFVAPFLTENEISRAVGTTVIHLLSYSVLAGLLACYLSPAVAFLVVVVLYLLLPHWGAHYPVGAYPIVYHMSFVLFFTGMVLYVRNLRRGGPVTGRSMILPGILLFFSYWIYEALWILFLSVSLTVAAIEAKRRQSSGELTGALRIVAFPVGIVLANAMVYGGYRAMFPGHYAGSTLNWGTVTNVGGIWHALNAFSIRSLPCRSFVELMSSIRDMSAIQYIAWNITAIEVVQTLLAGLCIVLFLNVQWRSDPATSLRRGKAAIYVAVFAVLMAFAIPLLPAMTVKYQNDPLYSPYIPGYFAFTMYGVATAAVIVGTASLVGSRASHVRIAFQVFAAVVVMFASAATAVANTHVISLLDLEGLKWRMVNGFLQSSLFRQLPDGAVVVAPSLWRGLDPAFKYYNDYWTRYVQGHSGRRVTVQRAFSGGERNLYYLDVSSLVGSRSGLMLVSKVAKPLVQSTYFEGENVTAMCTDRPRFGSISFLTSTGTSADPPAIRDGVSGERKEIGPLEFLRDGSLYAASVAHPSIVLGTASVVVATEALERTSTAVTVEFGKGFSVIERARGTYWRWSDGADGTGTVSFVNNAGIPLIVRFHSTIRTGTAEKKKFEIRTGQGSVDERLFANGDRLSFHVAVPVSGASVRLQSYAPRINAGPDGRHIIFGLQDWKVTAVPAADAVQAESAVAVTGKRGLGNRN